MLRRAHKPRRLKTKSGLDYYSLYLCPRRVSRDLIIIFLLYQQLLVNRQSGFLANREISRQYAVV